MSKLSETVCIKITKEDKKFLDGLDNKSRFIRDFIETYLIANKFISGEYGDEPINIDDDEMQDIWEFVQQRSALRLIAMAKGEV